MTTTVTIENHRIPKQNSYREINTNGDLAILSDSYRDPVKNKQIFSTYEIKNCNNRCSIGAATRGAIL